MAKSIDLTTLTGWSALSSGSHSITIVAKADGYRDSEPSAAVIVEKASTEPVEDPFITFTGETSDFTLTATNKKWDGTVEYSTDRTTWTTWDGTAISSNNKKLYLRGSGNTTFCDIYGAQFVLSAKAGCSGNLNTLLEYSNPPTTLSTKSCYSSMFSGCTNLTTAPELPATTLAEECYSTMFYNCTNLTQAPELPATTLAEYCYVNMFNGCTSLTQAPVLPATTLSGGCYRYMFERCTSLTAAPELPATTLADWCYSNMFYGCTSLKISATQSSEYPTAWRIPSSGTISSTATDWNSSMLSGTGGTFKSNPSINTTYYGAWKTATNLISFTIAGTSYQAEEGMTWEEWCNSDYNTGGFYVHNNRISTTGTNFISTKNIQSTEYAEYSTNVIAKETVYYLLSLNTTPPSGGGGGVGN